MWKKLSTGVKTANTHLILGVFLTALSSSGQKRYLNFCKSSRKGLWLAWGNECISHHRSKSGGQTGRRGTAWGREQGLDGLERVALAFQPCQLCSLHTTGIPDNLQGVVTPNAKTAITERQDEYSIARVTRPVDSLWETLTLETHTGIIYAFVFYFCSLGLFPPLIIRFSKRNFSIGKSLSPLKGLQRETARTNIFFLNRNAQHV